MLTCPTCQCEWYAPGDASRSCPNGCGEMQVTGGGETPTPPAAADPYHVPLTWKDPAAYAATYMLGSHLDGLDQELEKRVANVMWQAFQLWQDRQLKYGVTNIQQTGAPGCWVRSVDKLSRLREVYLNGAKSTPDESISDTWLDLINYAVMGYMCHHGLWPGVSPHGKTSRTG